eukprot:6822535-Pyramimonas_sp.AAC.1
MSGGGGPSCDQALRTWSTRSAWAAVGRGVRSSLGSETPQKRLLRAAMVSAVPECKWARR